MALENLQCLEIACDELGYRINPSAMGIIIRVEHRTPFYFWRNKHPFNDYMGARIAEQAFQHEIFARLACPYPHAAGI